jgi:cupin fold WbuC family metalloprotein
LFDELTALAGNSARGRMHYNLHKDYADPCQRLLNAIGTNSYIPPHRHVGEFAVETLVVLRGSLAVYIFDDVGSILKLLKLECPPLGECSDRCVGVELPAATWHSVVALVDGSVLLELKAGPFNPEAPKELAKWAPAEGTAEAKAFHSSLATKAADFAGSIS